MAVTSKRGTSNQPGREVAVTFGVTVSEVVALIDDDQAPGSVRQHPAAHLFVGPKHQPDSCACRRCLPLREERGRDQACCRSSAVQGLGRRERNVGLPAADGIGQHRASGTAVWRQEPDESFAAAPGATMVVADPNPPPARGSGRAPLRRQRRRPAVQGEAPSTAGLAPPPAPQRRWPEAPSTTARSALCAALDRSRCRATSPSSSSCTAAPRRPARARRASPGSASPGPCRGRSEMVCALNRANPLAAGTALRRAAARSQVELSHAGEAFGFGTAPRGSHVAAVERYATEVAPTGERRGHQLAGQVRPHYPVPGDDVTRPEHRPRRTTGKVLSRPKLGVVRRQVRRATGRKLRPRLPVGVMGPEQPRPWRAVKRRDVTAPDRPAQNFRLQIFRRIQERSCWRRS